MADENLHPFEGCLMKFTNVFQRWQYRFFCLDPVRGVLEYYVSETGKKDQGAPRGVAHLRNATVLPSSEDEVTFTVTFRGGETFKLRARDSRERKLWTDRLRVASFFAPASTDSNVALVETETPANENATMSSATNSSTALAGVGSSTNGSNLKRSTGRGSIRIADQTLTKVAAVGGPEHAISTTDDPFLDAYTKIRIVRDQRNEIVAALSCFPRHGSTTSTSSVNQQQQQEEIRHFDRNSRPLLNLQACSLAAVESIEQCLKCLQQPAAAVNTLALHHHPYSTQKSSRLQISTTQTHSSAGTNRSRSSTRSVSPAAVDNSMGNLPGKAAHSMHSATRHLSHVGNESAAAGAARRRSPPEHAAANATLPEQQQRQRSTDKNSSGHRRRNDAETGSGAGAAAITTTMTTTTVLEHGTSSAIQPQDSDTSFENFYGRSLRKQGAEEAPAPSLLPDDGSMTSSLPPPGAAETFPTSPARSAQQSSQKEVFFTPASLAAAAAAAAADAETTQTREISPPSAASAGPPFSNLLRDRNEDEETSDNDVSKNEEDLGSIESQKSVIMHLLGQLRIGMDLTKVVLPTFILERRSLLEMFADYMAHAHMLLRVSDLDSSRDRMFAILEWYLTSFHACRKGSIAKKPYNPVVGEQFHCSWHVPRRTIQQAAEEFQQSVHKSSPKSGKNRHSIGSGGGGGGNSTTANGRDFVSVRYCGEQVSHHPPITAFFIDCPEKGLQANCAIYTKSKFMGLSIGVSMVGNCSLFLRHHDEEYTFGLPSAYARSILTLKEVFPLPHTCKQVPWTELGGKLEIDCQKSGLVSEINFHTKPFYGGKLHRVTAEVRDRRQGNKLLCTVEGEWDKFFKFTYTEQKLTKQIDVDTLELMHKRVRPIEKQSANESRRLWRHVTQNLESGDIEAATEHKKALEDRQRSEEKPRREQGIKYDPKGSLHFTVFSQYFKEMGEVDYRFRDLL